MPAPPPLATTLAIALLTLAYASAAAACVAWLRMRRGVRTPYTRKIFHFLILSVTLVVQLRWGLSGVVIFGSVVALLVLYALVRGPGFGFYEALARPTDAPHRSLFIFVPLATTALGGLAANLLFPGWAHVGYMVVACGDAVGEPVGTRWGRHPYRVPSLAGVAATRSLEGSAAVLLAGILAAFAALLATGVAAATAAAAALAVGAVTTAVEAISSHGIDNFTIQLAATGVAAALLG
jgi:phytol kinase